jgi:hypothetical protein
MQPRYSTLSARSAVAAICAAVLLCSTPSPALGASGPSATGHPLAAACTSSVGPGIPPPATVPGKAHYYHAAWYGQSGYLTLCPGDTATATVAIYNTGEYGWVTGRAGQTAYLGTTNPSPGHDQPSMLGGDGTMGSPSTGWPRYNRMAIQPAEYVGPGQVAWFQFSVKAPLTPGTYRLHLRPLIEGQTWMEDLGIYWLITVPETQPAEQFGLITKRGNDFFLRTETDATVLRPLAPPAAFNYGLDMRERSPDGRRIAFWVEAGGTAELHVADVPAATDTIVARFPNRAGTVAWSTDGTGILVSIGALVPETQLATPRTLVAVTVATGQTREVYQGPMPSNASLVPLIWRNAPELFAAYEQVPGAFDSGYTVIRPGRPVTKGEPGHAVIGMRAAFDGSYALWIDSPIIHAWPSQSFELAQERTGASVGGPKWWPRIAEVVYERGMSDGGTSTGSRIERWDPFTGVLTTVKDIPAKSALGSFVVRTDGSAIITQRADGLFELIELRTGTVTPVPTVSGEVIFGSIVLK